jgi:hypothetical protein
LLSNQVRSREEQLTCFSSPEIDRRVGGGAGAGAGAGAGEGEGEEKRWWWWRRRKVYSKHKAMNGVDTVCDRATPASVRHVEQCLSLAESGGGGREEVDVQS